MKILVTVTLALLIGIVQVKAELWETVILPSWQGDGHGPFDISDLDRDSDFDVAVFLGSLKLSYNQYPGEWEFLDYNPSPDVSTGHDGRFVDLDMDGDLDFLFTGTDGEGDVVGWIEFQGESQFVTHILAAQVQGFANYLGGDVSAGDLDGDGDNDFIAGTGINEPGFSIWINDGSGNFTVQDHPSSSSGFRLSTLTDFNEDGLLDFAAVQVNRLLMFLANPDQTFTEVPLIDDGRNRSFRPPIAVDFDYDGDVDFLVCLNFFFGTDQDGIRLLWFENEDGSTVTIHELWDDYYGNIPAFVPLDLNNDGHMDLAVGNQLLFNVGDNLHFIIRNYAENNDNLYTQLKAADIDGDGDMDILNQEVRWFVNPFISRRIEIGLDALQTDVPANGGFITYHGALLNNMANPRYLRVWSTVTFPGGNESTVWSMRRVFQPDQVYEADTIQQYIPPAAPPGTYTFTVHFGDPDQLDIIGDSFQFEKQGQGADAADFAYSIPSCDWFETSSAPEFSRASGPEPSLDSFSDPARPGGFSLSTHPNPFNAATSVSVTLPEVANIKVNVYNVTGQKVAELANGQYSAGEHTFTFDGSHVASGLYFVRATVPGELNATQKVMLVR